MSHSKNCRVDQQQVSAGGLHTLLLRSDGRVVACGSNGCGQCQIPPLDEGSGLSYTEVSGAPKKIDD